MPLRGMNIWVVLNYALIMVLSIAVMNFMTITDIEAKKYERNEQLTEVRFMYCDILEIFLATELKYFSFLIFLQFNSTKMHFLSSLCQTLPWTLVIQWWATHAWILLLLIRLTWLCMIIFLPLVIHGKMAVFCRKNPCVYFWIIYSKSC